MYAKSRSQDRLFAAMMILNKNVRGTENFPKTPRKQGFHLPSLPQQFLKVSMGFPFNYFLKMLPGI